MVAIPEYRAQLGTETPPSRPGMINRTKRTLDQLGPMRPGLIGRQYRNPQERKTPLYYINYTHQMEIQTKYLQTGNLKAVRVEVPNFERFHKLVD